MKKISRPLVGWVGLLVLISALAGAFAAKWTPPVSPTLTADQLSKVYMGNAGGIRLGSLFIMIAAGFYLPFTGLISSRMRMMEGKTPLWSYIQMLSGLFVAISMVLPFILMDVAVFRPTRDAQIVETLSDLALILSIAPAPPVIMQNVSIGICVLEHDKADGALPRWVGYLNFFVAVMYLPGALVIFNKTGPLAWNGLLGYWAPLGGFGIWLIAMTAALVRGTPDSAESAGI